MRAVSLADWGAAGVLRQLDRAFAAFIAELDPDSGRALAVAAAMLSRVEGLGHTGLPVSALLAAESSIFDWPADSASRIGSLWKDLPLTLDDWRARLGASRVVHTVGTDPDLGQPLVLDPAGGEPRLYLRRYWQYEQSVASAIRLRCRQPPEVDEAAARRWLDRLFEPEPLRPALPPHATQDAVPNWQKIACAIAARGRLTLITGGPGTGKTYTAARIVALIAALSTDPRRLEIALAAPTGKAAARLRQSIRQSILSLAPALAPELDLIELGQRIESAQTLHALLGAAPDSRRFKHHAGHPLNADLVIVDEASMIHLEMMAALLSALPDSARLVLIGDKDQLASVEAGAVLGDLCSGSRGNEVDADTARYIEASTGIRLPAATIGDTVSMVRNHTVMLRHSQRFGGPIGRLARAVNDADATLVASLAQPHPDSPLHVAEKATVAEVIALATTGRAGAAASHRDYLLPLAARTVPTDPSLHTRWVLDILAAFDRFRVLCAVRDGSWGASGLNQAIERALAHSGLLRPSSLWYPGRPVMVTRNAPSLGVFNGDIGIALPTSRDPAQLRVYFADGEAARAISPGRLAQVETAFATTVHKSQGSEFEHAMLVLGAHSGQVLTRELLYTGLTRARSALTILSEEAGLIAQAIARPTQRQGGLRTLHEPGTLPGTPVGTTGR